MITVEPTLFHGAPQGERLQKELDTYQALTECGIDFFRADHEAAATIEFCHEVEGVLGAEICKNLLLCNRQGTVFYLLLMPGEKPFKTKELSKQLGCARLSFASGEKMEELVNITPGSLSVAGLLFDKENRVNLLIDKDLLKEDVICFHPCINTSTVKIKTEDLLQKFLPFVHHEPTFVELIGTEPEA